ncbi:MAG: methylmalonyl-CoA mutase family protein, partial [Bacteroidota bacterium]|nr:methylmalonyl-CoA mutase family protein [Bacteroidota bacterium]
HTGENPIVGVNTFLSKEGSPTLVPGEVIRATQPEKQLQLSNLEALQSMSGERASQALADVQNAAVSGDNIFDVLMDACKWCSLGQLTEAMFEVGGAYRRNM